MSFAMSSVCHDSITFRALTAAIVVALSCAANAQVTIGDYDCGQWFTAERRQPAQAWLLGYLTGSNEPFAGSGKEPLRRLNSADQAYLWVDNYCKANPLQSVSDAGKALLRELSKAKQ